MKSLSITIKHAACLVFLVALLTACKPVAVPPVANANTLVPAATSTSVIDTSNWKTYRNEEYGFEVKYPAQWVFTDLPHGEYDANLLLFEPLNSHLNNKDSSFDKPGFYIFPNGEFDYGLPAIISQQKVVINEARFTRTAYQNFDVITLANSTANYSKFFRIEIHYGTNIDSKAKEILETIFSSIRLTRF